ILEKPLPKDSAEDSFSFLPLLKGKKDNLRPPVIITNNGIFSITYKHWKYINGKGPGGFTNMIMEKFPNILPRDEYDGQLYNLSEDIGERHNLYAENPEKVKELSDLLDVYIKKPTRPIK
ncbi:hypothetical protein LCGC14_3137960, partial [marine sediment metagenome]